MLPGDDNNLRAAPSTDADLTELDGGAFTPNLTLVNELIASLHVGAAES